MPISARRRAAALLALAFSAAAVPLGAQAVHGRLVDPAGAAVEQVLVALLGPDGKQLGGAITGAGGEFLIRAPGAGRYSLRAERVGYATVVSPAFDLGAGETREERLTASSRPVTLQGLVVTPAARRCAVRREAGATTAALWDEAHKVLAAADFAGRAGLYWFDVTHWERDLGVGSGAVTRDARTSRSGASELPFVSVPPEELSRYGYIRRFPGDSLVYAAPDAAILLSDAFLDDHCFRVTTGPDTALVGLAFEPVRGRNVPEVTGVLWLDRRTAELRRVEYRYVNGPPESNEPEVGGTVEFERLRDGPWIVRRWAIRMPVAERVMSRGVSYDGRSAVRSEQLRLVAVHEAGGEVISASPLVAGVPGRPLGVASGAQPGAVEGVVYDSLARAPLAGARVFLSGTGAEATTDAQGRYRLEAPAAGTYTVAFAAPALGPLAAAVRPRTVTAVAGETTRADLAVPAAPTVAAALCPAASLRTHRGLVAGRVLGVALDSVVVRATWLQVGISGSGIAASSSYAEAVPDKDGHYLLCGVPEGTNVEVAVRPAARERQARAANPRGSTLREPGRELSRVEVTVFPGTPLRMDVGPGAAGQPNPGPRPE